MANVESTKKRNLCVKEPSKLEKRYLLSSLDHQAFHYTNHHGEFTICRHSKDAFTLLKQRPPPLYSDFICDLRKFTCYPGTIISHPKPEFRITWKQMFAYVIAKCTLIFLKETFRFEAKQISARAGQVWYRILTTRCFYKKVTCLP